MRMQIDPLLECIVKLLTVSIKDQNEILVLFDLDLIYSLNRAMVPKGTQELKKCNRKFIEYDKL